MTNCKSDVPRADQPKRTLLTGFGSFDSVAQDSIPKHQHPYCNQNQGDRVWPRCPILEKVFNREMFNNEALNYTTNAFDDIFYPPKFIRPSNQENPRERIITTIGQVIKVLDWWVNEKVEPSNSAFWYYAYSHIPCYRRVLKSGIDFAIGGLIKKYKFTQPAIATKLEKLIHNLAEKTTEWDNSVRQKQESQSWIYKSPSKAIYFNPIEVKRAVAALRNELWDIDRYLKSLKNKGNDYKPTKTIKKKAKIKTQFSFKDGRAFFDDEDLRLPTGAELNPVKILKKLVKSFDRVVKYKSLDKNSSRNEASVFLRGKISLIRRALKKCSVPCHIQARKWEGYILTNSSIQS